jgi:small neutral amino acid transporter SnatA (MarC family)
VDPIGNIPLFTAVTARLDPAHRRRVLVISVALAAFILTLFAVFGVEVFGYFGVTLGDFMIACGVILTVFSLFYLVKPYEQGVAAEGVEVAVVPLAVPFLAGPASISYVLLLSRETGLFHSGSDCSSVASHASHVACLRTVDESIRHPRNPRHGENDAYLKRGYRHLPNSTRAVSVVKSWLIFKIYIT